ncbi:MAG: hypothetical protein DRJ52_01940 [Thermoprotei archaeon]|nr:MAG: hypothetical protein DRJ52_01940 [Thermoprotei archaeon]RLE99921.1 MAG: hypothetical protein DRJ63_03985 [Thermoprotei archaeon]HDI74771.1 hypothetical protein [Thermoprotei archaeon]
MTEEREILEALIKEVKEAAEKEAQRILEEASREAEKILKDAERRVNEVLREKIEKIRRQVRAEVSDKIALKKLKIRREYLMKKQQLLSSILNELNSQVNEIIEKNPEKYKQCLLKLVIEAALNMQSEVLLIAAAARDLDLLKEVLPKAEQVLSEKYSRRVKLIVDNNTIDAIGGIVARDQEGREYFNNTIEARLRRARDEVLPALLTKLLE